MLGTVLAVRKDVVPPDRHEMSKGVVDPSIGVSVMLARRNREDVMPIIYWMLIGKGNSAFAEVVHPSEPESRADRLEGPADGRVDLFGACECAQGIRDADRSADAGVWFVFIENGEVHPDPREVALPGW